MNNPPLLPSKRERIIIFLSWTLIVLLSTVPDILFSEITGKVPSWLVYGKMGLSLAAILAAIVFKPIRPLWRLGVIMIAYYGFNLLRPQFDFTRPWLQKLFGATAFDVRMQAEQIGKLAMTLAMIAVMLLVGLKRHDFFLVAGGLRNNIRPVKLLGFPKAEPWPKFGLIYGFGIAIVLGIVQYLQLRPDGSLFIKVLPMLPSVIFYAALNSFNEEMFLRAPIIAVTEPHSGTLNAMWMSAFFFGIAHYFGVPGGLFGALASIFMGWILSKAMVETRGLFWPFIIHILSDIVIFAFIAMSLVK